MSSPRTTGLPDRSGTGRWIRGDWGGGSARTGQDHDEPQLRHGITAAALGLDYTGEGSRWSWQALFIGLVLLPIIYLLAMIVAWRHREAIRVKSAAFGLFSLWFPLLTTLIAAWVILDLVPTLLGSPLRTLALFPPDLGVVLIASAVTGVRWAVVRLGVAYTGRPGPV